MDEQRLPGFSLSGLRGKIFQNKKAVLVFYFLLAVFSILSGATVFFTYTMLLKILQLSVFLGLGYLHQLMLKGNLAILTATEKLFYSMLLAVTVFILTSGYYFFDERYNLLLSVASACAFLLFYYMGELWRLFTGMTAVSVALWHLPKELLENQATVFLNSIPIRLKIQTDEGKKNELLFASRAPARMKLGSIFYHLIQEQKANGRIPADIINNDDNNEGWVFFTTSFAGFEHVLNPESTLIDNGITKNNTLIIARRVNEIPSLKTFLRQPQTPKDIL